MFRCSERNIAHQPEVARDLQHVPAMCNRIRQARIPIMAGDKVSEAFTHDPVFDLRARNVSPGKRFIRHRLVDPIHTHGVVRARSPERVPIRGIFRNVNAAPRVHQPAPSVHREPQTECVGMSVA